MSTWYANMKVTFGAVVTVEADTEDEARDKFRRGQFDVDRTNERIDWDDPRDITEDK